MKVNRKWMILAIMFLLLNMAVATQYAVTKIGYVYTIVHPSDASIRYIGSDNSSDGIRVLRVSGSNVTNIQLVLRLGDIYSSNMKKTFTAAFGLVNEETYPINITYINVSSSNYTYMKIWLHGNRTANANSTLTDPSSVFMWDNNTIVNATNTTAWTLASGDANSSGMCYNVSDRTNCTIPTPWDETAHVRYSINNSNASSGVSDFVWVQITVDIPESVESIGAHTGTIWIHLESDAGA
ncbi:MAG: hypothetical protein DRM98_05800 [Thermoplasmata archaeon]|nr:MAG: hypothetical protein DRM98_05800 [Thermoplasmata archaeon]RLF53535.1 MAG: hypothetical protein DRN24_00630 [Thermoplasmata archaeon]